MASDDRVKNWAEYYAATADRPPRRTLLEALARFEPSDTPRFAVDLGCGDGRDIVELLRRGWSVLAIDSEPAAIERLQSRPDLPEVARLTCLCQRFEDATWPEADLINASFSLPLCPPARFPGLWRRIVASLKPGGRFSGQLYGDRDGWAARSGMTHMNRAGAEHLLEGLNVELFDEEETDSVTPRGKPKHWHIFHIVAQRS
jgi:SAM-dependent methyltransferase